MNPNITAFTMIRRREPRKPPVTIIAGRWAARRVLFTGPIEIQIKRMRGLAIFLIKCADTLEAVAKT